MKRWFMLFAVLISLGVAGCGPQAGQPAPVGEAPTDGAVPEATTSEVEVTTDDTPAEMGADVLAFDPAEAGGSLVIGQGQEPDTLYIYGGSMLAASHVQNSLYDGPIEGLDFDYQAVILEALPKIEDEGSGATLETVSVEAGEQYVDPETQEVVTATETVADLQQITARFTIKEGVTWEDGTPVTADDSVFSHDLACHPDTPSSKFTCERTAGYTKVDERTVEWKGLPGFTDQTYYTNFYTPLPRHQQGADGTAMSEMEPAAILEDEVFTRRPMSYGPFKIVEWEAGDHITLAKNENYWRASEGLPFLDEVIHRFIPDSNSLLAALKIGDVDVATQDGMDLSQFDALEEGKANDELVPYYVIGTSWEHIDFNLQPVDERAPLGACQAVRHAIAYGTDRQTMVDVIQKGQSRVQDTFVPSEHWATPPEGEITTYPFDAEKAKQLLEDFGFTDEDGDGVRTAAKDITCTITTDLEGGTKDQVIPAGTPLELTLNTTSGNALREDTTLLFQQNMKDIGVKISLDYLASTVYFEDGPDGPLFGRRFDLGQFAWSTGVQPPVNLYFCTEIPGEDNAWAGQNETGWCNPDYDRAGKQASATLERDESLPLYHEAQRLFTEALPVLPLFAKVKVAGASPEVVNFRPNPTVNSETWNVESWGFRAAP